MIAEPSGPQQYRCLRLAGKSSTERNECCFSISRVKSLCSD